jgi:hypothetical protein
VTPAWSLMTVARFESRCASACCTVDTDEKSLRPSDAWRVYSASVWAASACAPVSAASACCSFA